MPASVTFSAPRSVSGRHLVKAVGDKGTSVPSRGFVIAPSLSLSPTGGVIGQKITATMRGFAAGEVITLRFRTAPGSSRTVAKNIVASSTGTASANFLVPSGSVGTYSIEAGRQPRRIRIRPIHPHLRHRRAPHRHTNRDRNSIPNRHQHHPAPPEPTATDEPAATAYANLDTSQCGIA